jgi:hypothetical protein
MKEVEEILELEVDASPLMSKIEELEEAVYSLQITTDQLKELIQSAFILHKSDPVTGLSKLYVDIRWPLDTQPLHL